MRRKIIQDFANTLCQILVGWRSGEDINTIGSLGDGIIKINLLNETFTHNHKEVKGLKIVGELKYWLVDQLKKYNIKLNDLESVLITSNTTIKKENKKNKATKIQLNWNIICSIKTNEKEYLGKLAETHQWEGAI